MISMKFQILTLLAYLIPVSIADFNETQDKYVVVFKRAVVSWYDKKVYEKYEIKTFKYNRTVATFNLTSTLKFDVTDYKLRIRAFKFSGNEYKLTAIQFEIDGCTMFTLGRIGLKGISTNSNVTNCPIKKGTYVVYNAYMDSSSFPPHFPEGNWKIQVEGIINGAISVRLHIYLDIQYPLKRRWQ